MLARRRHYFRFQKILSDHSFPDIIDYLRLDIEPAENTFKCLMRIPFSKYQFRVITFEHDLYFMAANKFFKEKAFNYLSDLGYIRIADNVQNDNNAYEDWYVNQNKTPEHLLQTLPADSNFEVIFDSK